MHFPQPLPAASDNHQSILYTYEVLFFSDSTY